MATHRPTPSTPPDLTEGGGSDLPLDHALSLLLADETENALRWGAAVLESGPWTPSALVVTARLLDQMGRRRAATEGLKLAFQQSVAAGNLPLAMAAVGDLRSLGSDVEDSLKHLASAFCRGSDRLRDTAAPALLPQLGEFQPLSPFLTGPALASKAAQILESVRETETRAPETAPSRVAPLPLFSALAEEPLHDLLAAFETVTVPAGHTVIREGGEEAAAYIVARGELEVSRRPTDDGGKPLVLARLGSGAFFGEMAILSQLPGAASVIATRPTILLVARREALEAVVEKHPEVAAELAAHCRRQSVANLGWASPVIVAIPPAARAALVERFETRMFEAGDKLVETGEEAGGLHLVVSGEVAVVAYESGERVVLATLTPGETVGEVELVLCRDSGADAIAVRPTATLFLPRAQFFSLVHDHPAVLHGLYGISVRRLAETNMALEAGASTMTDDAMLDEPTGDYAALVDNAPPPLVEETDAAAPRITPLGRGTMSLPRVTTPPRGTPLPVPASSAQPVRRTLPPPPLPPPPPPVMTTPVRNTMPLPMPRTGRTVASVPPPIGGSLSAMAAAGASVPPPISGSVAPTAAAVMARVQASREPSQRYGMVALVAVAAGAIAVLALRSINGPAPAAGSTASAAALATAIPATARTSTLPAEPLEESLERAAAAKAPNATGASSRSVSTGSAVAAAVPVAKERIRVASPAAPKVIVEPNPSPFRAPTTTPSAPPVATASSAPAPASPALTAAKPPTTDQALTAGEFGGRE
jgi:cAMP-dependent protein kinase regulator